ncbi:MAG: hypothetical protein IJX80_09380 [Clostridia bacterium]|nr:hypothetical protein [Clostridia bacterium]
MFRYKSHKQAFIMTVLVILLCLVCLTGATLALFTSDPNDGTIGIITTSGDVEVDIVDTQGVTLQNRALAFLTTSGSMTDSENVLFEPGATFRTQGFQIKNTGDIPVNFSLSVSKDDKINMEEFDKAFELWIVKEGDDFRGAKRITEFKVNGLAVGESSETYYLFIKMKESVGNEFQGKTYTGIGVTVYAVQGNAQLN